MTDGRALRASCTSAAVASNRIGPVVSPLKVRV
jgi:hypothetical protein